MNEVLKALYAFWNGFGIPAYPQTDVPKGAAFPYITYEVLNGTGFGANVLTAFVWAKDRADVVTYMDKIRDGIPNGGTRLSMGDGFLTIYPNDTNFMMFYDDPTDDKVKGGRISYEVHFYH